MLLFSKNVSETLCETLLIKLWNLMTRIECTHTLFKCQKLRANSWVGSPGNIKLILWFLLRSTIVADFMRFPLVYWNEYSSSLFHGFRQDNLIQYILFCVLCLLLERTTLDIFSSHFHSYSSNGCFIAGSWQFRMSGTYRRVISFEIKRNL